MTGLAVTAFEPRPRSTVDRLCVLPSQLRTVCNGMSVQRSTCVNNRLLHVVPYYEVRSYDYGDLFIGVKLSLAYKYE